jgi:hypothetical protein
MQGMLGAMASGALLRAPADRPAEARGWRARLAGGVALAALPVLAISSATEGGERAANLLSTAALVAAAVLIWTARRPSGLVVAGGLVVAAVAAVSMAGITNRYEVQGSNRWGEMVYSYEPGGTAITRAQARAVPRGSTEDELVEILGSEAGSGTWSGRGGRDMRCLVYRAQGSRGPIDELFAFCFAGERYVSLQRW